MTKAKQPYTVLLLYPSWLAAGSGRDGTYMAWVQASDVRGAISAAVRAYQEETGRYDDADDAFEPLAVFPAHVEDVMTGDEWKVS